ncbi:MAG: hypothetical protein AAFY45_18925 [Bacteroidota bacterium]
MSSFKEIVFIVQKSETQSLGFERIAMEMARAIEPNLKAKLVVVSPPPKFALNTSLPLFGSLITYLNFLFACLFSSLGKDLVYILGKDAGLSLPLIRIFSGAKVFTQIHYRHKRTDRKNYQYRLWERISERLTLKFSDRVFVDNEQARSFFKEEYGQETKLIAYGADHIEEAYKVVSPTQKDKKYAVSFMPASSTQAIMALKSFAQYPKYDYYLILENSYEYLSDEIKAYQEYSHIHFIIPEKKFEPFLMGAYMYIHLEPTIKARLRLLEAMMMGKHVLCFNSSFSRNLTASEASYFSNHSQLLSALHKAVKQSHFDQGKHMQKLATRLNWTTAAEQVLEELESLGEEVLIPEMADL